MIRPRSPFDVVHRVPSLPAGIANRCLGTRSGRLLELVPQVPVALAALPHAAHLLPAVPYRPPAPTSRPIRAVAAIAKPPPRATRTAPQRAGGDRSHPA